MEAESAGSRASTDDVTSEDGRRTNAARVGVDSGSSPCRPTTGVRRIDVTPAASNNNDVLPTQSTETTDAMQCSWRPMKPGYAANASAGDAVLIEQTVKVEDFDNDDNTDSSFHLAIPAMSLTLAVACAVCNIISPGLGEFDM